MLEISKPAGDTGGSPSHSLFSKYDRLQEAGKVSALKAVHVKSISVRR